MEEIKKRYQNLKEKKHQDILYQFMQSVPKHFSCNLKKLVRLPNNKTKPAIYTDEDGWTNVLENETCLTQKAILDLLLDLDIVYDDDNLKTNDANKMRLYRWINKDTYPSDADDLNLLCRILLVDEDVLRYGNGFIYGSWAPYINAETIKGTDGTLSEDLKELNKDFQKTHGSNWDVEDHIEKRHAKKTELWIRKNLGAVLMDKPELKFDKFVEAINTITREAVDEDFLRPHRIRLYTDFDELYDSVYEKEYVDKLLEIFEEAEK